MIYLGTGLTQWRVAQRNTGGRNSHEYFFLFYRQSKHRNLWCFRATHTSSIALVASILLNILIQLHPTKEYLALYNAITIRNVFPNRHAASLNLQLALSPPYVIIMSKSPKMNYNYLFDSVSPKKTVKDTIKMCRELKKKNPPRIIPTYPTDLVVQPPSSLLLSVAEAAEPWILTLCLRIRHAQPIKRPRLPSSFLKQMTCFIIVISW